MTAFTVKFTSAFKKDYKRAIRQGRDINRLDEVIALLASGQPLPEKFRDHKLSGNWANHRECHVQPDWLLIYHIKDSTLVLTLTSTGSHSDLFS